MKKRVAVWMDGGIGTGHFSQGYPMLEKVLDGLSSSFDLVVYSRFVPNKDFRSSTFTVRSAPSQIKITVIRWLYLIFLFLKDHRKKKFDLTLAFWGYPAGFFATALSKLIRISSAVYLLGGDSFGIPSIDFGILHKPVLRKIALWAYRRTTLLLGISEFQKAQLAIFGVERIKIIPWGVERNLFKLSNKTQSELLRIIHVGHLNPVKDQSTLLKAFALILKQQHAELKIIGTDQLSGAIQRLARELGVSEHVQFLDMVPYSQMPQLYEWADMMMHTSIVEGQSMALTEAAASGVLLAGTRVGLIHDLGEECAVVVDVGDAEGLASKVLALLRNQEEWNKRIANARQWAENHDLVWTVRELEFYLRSI